MQKSLEKAAGAKVGLRKLVTLDTKEELKNYILVLGAYKKL